MGRKMILTCSLLQNNSVNAFIDSFQFHMKDICCLVAERELSEEVLKCIFNLFNGSSVTILLLSMMNVSMIQTQ